MKLQSLLTIFALSFFSVGCGEAQPQAEPGKEALGGQRNKALRLTFEERRDQILQKLDSHRPKVERTPAGALASSATDFAMWSFLADKEVEEANRLLREYADFFIANRNARNDQHSLYWTTELTARLISLFGRDGSMAPGRLDPAVQDRLLEMMWEFVRETSYVDSLEEIRKVYATTDTAARHAAGDPMPVSANIVDTQTWDVIESENHHAMTWMTLWDFTRLLIKSPEYRDRKLSDGRSVAEHYQAWTKYGKEYIRERARRGLFVEMADDTYNSFTLKGVYNLNDFADDPQLRELASNLLTLYFASWAQEQIDGVRGGGKSRMNLSKDRRSITAIARLLYFYTGVGVPSGPGAIRWSALTSSYRLPGIVANLVNDVEARGEYEVINHPLAMAQDGHWSNPHYHFRISGGGVIRYSYCTPDFVMGMPMVPPRRLTQWTKLSSQGRWQGVIFAGDRDIRIFVQTGTSKGSNNNQQYGVQRKGTMITQRLPEGKFARGTAGTRIWVSDNGLGNRIEGGGWAFVEAPGAYAAFRPARGGFRWETEPEAPKDGSKWKGSWMVFGDESSPAILEVTRKHNYPDLEAFRAAVMALPLEWQNERLTYTGLDGNKFEFTADLSALPKIDGMELNYDQPEHAFFSPFVKSAWESGLVEISDGKQKMTLDFTVGENELRSELESIRKAREKHRQAK